MKKEYCDKCGKDMEYTESYRDMDVTIKDLKITFRGKVGLCVECGWEIISDEMMDENIDSAQKRFFELKGEII